jgi:16S rRNA (cytidine1402-2'-O)-methyltransferase
MCRTRATAERIMGERTDDSGERWMQASGAMQQDVPTRSLYVVGLPIGNAADITLRALRLLSQMDIIAAEDTRTTRPLLNRFSIDVPLIAAHEHNEREAAAGIVGRLARGERVALVSDAGTPGVSDPGALIVRAVLDAGYRVIPVPGASSAIAAVSAAGLAPGAFCVVGFLPTTRGERERMLRSCAADGRPFVLFEAPHRIRALVALLAESLAADRRVVLARELTKKFEQVTVQRAGSLGALAVEERGEYVVLVDAAAAATGSIDPTTARWLAALVQELPPARAAAVAAKATGLPREMLYRRALDLKPGGQRP